MGLEGVARSSPVAHFGVSKGHSHENGVKKAKSYKPKEAQRSLPRLSLLLSGPFPYITPPQTPTAPQMPMEVSFPATASQEVPSDLDRIRAILQTTGITGQQSSGQPLSTTPVQSSCSSPEAQVASAMDCDS